MLALPLLILHQQGKEEERSPRQELSLMVLLLSPKSHQWPRDCLAYLVNKVDDAEVIPSLGNVFQLRAAAFPVTPGCTPWGTPHKQRLQRAVCPGTHGAGSTQRKKRMGECIPAGLNAP